MKTIAIENWLISCLGFVLLVYRFIMNPEEDRSRGCSSYDYLGDVEGHIFLDPSPLCIKKQHLEPVTTQKFSGLRPPYP